MTGAARPLRSSAGFPRHETLERGLRAALWPTEQDGGVPLSHAQQRIWIAHERAADSAQFNIPLVIRLIGALHPEALAQSLNALLRRHAILRTVYCLRDGEPVQQAAAAARLHLADIDLTRLREEDARREADRLTRAEISRPFNLARDLMLRATLLRLRHEEFRVVTIRHHIASDGWSLGILLRELAHFYQAFRRGHAAPLPDLALQYANYAAWQRATFDPNILEPQLRYWRRNLLGADPALFASAAPEGRLHAGGVKHHLIDSDVAHAVRSWCRSSAITLFQALLAVFLLVLHQRTGRTDIVIGTDYTNRNRIETESLIGTFVSRLPLRCDLEGDPSVDELARRVGATTRAACAHADVPFEQLASFMVRQPGQRGHARLHAMFGLHGAPRHAPYRALKLHGLQNNELLDFAIPHSEFPLSLYATDAAHGLPLEIRYDPGAFAPESIETMLHRFERLLHLSCASPAHRLSELCDAAGALDRQDASAFARVRAATWKSRAAGRATSKGGAA